MIDNFKLIKPLLKFTSEDDFYFLQVIQRKKDTKPGQKVSGANNNSRLIQAYYIRSLDYLEGVEEEIKQLCKVFNARAGINLNKRSLEKMHLQHIKKLIDQSLSFQFTHSHKAYSSVVGAFNHATDKVWIIDLDEVDMPYENLFVGAINNRRVLPEGNKIIARIPSKTGVHLITKPFNIAQYKIELEAFALTNDLEILEADIHKNNPTNIYIP